MKLPAIRTYGALAPRPPPRGPRLGVAIVESVELQVQVLDAGQAGPDTARPPPFEPRGRTLGRYVDTWA